MTRKLMNPVKSRSTMKRMKKKNRIPAKSRSMTKRRRRNDMTEKHIGIVAAPGAPDRLAKQIKAELPDMLGRELDEDIEWEVSTHVDPLTGYAELIEELYEKTDEYREKYDWDHTIFITDLPVYHEEMITTVDINNKTGVGLISLPAFGWPPIKQSVLKTIVSILGNIREDAGREELTATFNNYLKTSRVYYEEVFLDETESDHSVYYIKDSWRGRLRLIAGMSWANNPFNMMRSLSSVVALAFATGTFSMLFSTMWNLSNLFPLGRMIAISLLAVSAMALWIIISHDLWEKVRGKENKRILILYNGATAQTLFISVLFYFAVLYMMFFTAALVLLPPGYVVNHIVPDEVTIVFYIEVAWFAASLSTVVGAIGAGVQDQDLIKKSTYGYRQRYREQYKSSNDV
ncbi:5,10-methylene-tetrahydrofolate dehydrogenase [Salinicoccus halitifaciens]|nr:5,10-methylene-tetrahydrofolate dehydrogenase [Salinicoccus halitifaciens]